MSNLAKRLATAAIVIPVLVGAMFFDPTGYGILVGTVLTLAIAGDEYLRMALPVDAADRAMGLRATFAVAGAALVVGCFFFTVASALPPLLTTAAVACSAAVLVRRRRLPDAGRHMAAVLAGLVYVPMMACVWPLLLRFEPTGAWLFFALALAFGCDTGAYFCGRAFGRHKLYPEVSPNKTVEGALGGLVGGVAATVGFGSAWLLPDLPLGHAVALGLAGSVLAQIGDLAQSMAKRTFGVKDSGKILPGHGGMLDRIDSLLFVAPLVYYYGVLVADAGPG